MNSTPLHFSNQTYYLHDGYNYLIGNTGPTGALLILLIKLSIWKPYLRF
jgi:hypothetical protein